MIVITGGAGFIGSALCWGLNKKGHEDILIVDSQKTPSNWENLLNLKFTDYIDSDSFVRKLEQNELKDIDGILHMGACSSTTEKNTGFLLCNNYEYTRRLADWCIKNDKRLVYASSAATYGDGNQGFSDDHASLPRLRPLNAYGYSKQLFDLWALKNGHLDKIAGLKYFNVFGPNEYHKGDMASVVFKTFNQIKSTGKMRLFKSHNPQYNDGGQLRDFIYVKDVVDATLYLFSNPRVNGIFNIGTGVARSFKDLTTAAFHSMDKEPNIEYIDMPEGIREQYQYFTQAEMTKLRHVGYSKKMHTLEEGVNDYVKNYLLKKNPYFGNEV
jgi:ADP-L-glycero-D-manno-heptose 6-epimerase